MAFSYLSSVLEFFGLTEEDTPVIRIIDLSSDMAKYAFNEEITADKLAPFLTAFLEGKVKVRIILS